MYRIKNCLSGLFKAKGNLKLEAHGGCYISKLMEDNATWHCQAVFLLVK
jgi:hypothetical protein